MKPCQLKAGTGASSGALTGMRRSAAEAGALSVAIGGKRQCAEQNLLHNGHPKKQSQRP